MPMAHAQRGFSIEAGLLYDHPNNNTHDRPFPEMQPGYGYIANLGYDIIDRIGLEIGVMHTTHDYNLFKLGDEILEDNAEKTTFFIKARGIPWKKGKFEVVTALGAGFFDISGNSIRKSYSLKISEDFSGWGAIANLNLRYHVTGGLAATFYLGANFVDYNKYTLFGYPYRYVGKMPGGDSINWGITIFHRIGNPQI